MKKNQSTYIGVIGATLAVIILAILVFLLERPLMGLPKFVVLIIYVLTIIISVSMYATANPGLGIKMYFSQGFRTFIIFTFIMIIFTFCYFSYDQTNLESGIRQNAILLKQEGNHTQDEIQRNSEQLRKIFMPMMLSVTTIILLILGSLTSLITAAFVKNK